MSIVIPIYKVEKYLEECIESVIAQTYKHIEIILVDDGSPDRCPEICDKYSEKYENIIVIHKDNGGLSDARNCGIKNSHGEYILFLDSDDTIECNTIKTMLDIAIDEKADVVIPDRYIKVFENSDRTVLCYHFDERGYISNPREFALDVIIGMGRAWRASAVLYKQSVIINNACKFPVGYTAEDIIFNLQVMEYSKKVAFCKMATLHNLKRKGSITNTFNIEFFKTILFIDNKVEQFLGDINVSCKDGRRYSLLSRNVIIYLLSLIKSNYKRQTKKQIFNEIINNDNVQEALAVDMGRPYFNNKYIGIMCVILHDLLAKKRYNVAYALMCMINFMR